MDKEIHANIIMIIKMNVRFTMLIQELVRVKMIILQDALVTFQLKIIAVHVKAV